MQWRQKPPGAGVCVRVLRVHPGQTWFVRIFERFRWIPLHWVDGKTLPHAERGCKHCATRYKAWKGYASGAVLRTTEEGETGWTRVVVEVPSEADHGVMRPHLVYKFSRHANGRSRPLLIEVTDHRPPNLSTQPFPVEPSLQKLWGSTG